MSAVYERCSARLTFTMNVVFYLYAIRQIDIVIVYIGCLRLVIIHTIGSECKAGKTVSAAGRTAQDKHNAGYKTLQSALLLSSSFILKCAQIADMASLA